MKKITIYEVAKLANVSLATVSRVMNSPELVKEKTRIKVSDAIAKLGYRPNAIAQSLAMSRTTTIALIISSASDSFIGEVMNGISDTSKVYNYNLLLYKATSGINEINDICESIIKQHADGIIVCLNQEGKMNLKAIEINDIPVVFVGAKVSDNSQYSIYVDYEQMVYDLVKQALDKGKNKVAILHDRKNSYVSKMMKQGAEKAYKEHKLSFKNYIDTSNFPSSSFVFLKDYLKDKQYDMIITNRDSQASAVCNVCKEYNIDIPNTCEVVCLNDTKYNEIVRPQISSFKTPGYDIGAIGLRVLTKLLNKETVKEKQQSLTSIYYPRKTTRN